MCEICKWDDDEDVCGSEDSVSRSFDITDVFEWAGDLPGKRPNELSGIPFIRVFETRIDKSWAQTNDVDDSDAIGSGNSERRDGSFNVRVDGEGRRARYGDLEGDEKDGTGAGDGNACWLTTGSSVTAGDAGGRDPDENKFRMGVRKRLGD